MKRFSIALNIILIAGIAFYLLRVKQFSKPITSPQLVNNQNAPCIDCNNYTFNGIQLGNAKLLANNYRTYINSNDNIDKTRSAWFSLNGLKAFICVIEQAAHESNCNNLKLGVRIYYGRYPNSMPSPDFSSLPKTYINHHTLFMVPTYESSAEPLVNTDFNPLDISSTNCIVPLDTSSKNDQKPITILTAGMKLLLKNGEVIKNHGDLIPPGNSSGAKF